VPTRFPWQSSRSWTTKTIPCEAVDILIADAGTAACVALAVIVAMQIAIAARSLCISGLSVLIKVAALGSKTPFRNGQRLGSASGR
jgi:hypothetical protein